MPLQLMLIVNLSIPSSPVTSLHVGHHDQKDLKWLRSLLNGQASRMFQCWEALTTRSTFFLNTCSDAPWLMEKQLLSSCLWVKYEQHVCAVHDTKLKPWRLYIQYGEVPFSGPVFSFYWTFMGYLRGCLLLFMFESLISNLMQSDTVVIDFWVIKCTLLYLISKQGWLAGLWFCCERSCLPLSLPLTALSSVSFAKIQYLHLPHLLWVCVCVCLLWGRPVWVFLLQCSFRLTDGSFLSMGLMDWHIQHPSPHSLAHTCKHGNKLGFVALSRLKKGYFGIFWDRALLCT